MRSHVHCHCACLHATFLQFPGLLFNQVGTVVEVLLGVPRMRLALQHSFSRCGAVDKLPFLFSRCVPSPFNYSDGIVAQWIMLALALVLTRLREGDTFRNIVQPSVLRKFGRVHLVEKFAAAVIGHRLRQRWKAQHQRDMQARRVVYDTLQKIEAWKLTPGNTVVAALSRARPPPPADVHAEAVLGSSLVARVNFRVDGGQYAHGAVALAHGLAASALAHRVQLAATCATVAGPMRFRVYAKELGHTLLPDFKPVREVTLHDVGAAHVVSCDVTSLLPGRRYDVVVCGVNDAGEGAASSVARMTMPPPTPDLSKRGWLTKKPATSLSWANCPHQDRLFELDASSRTLRYYRHDRPKRRWLQGLGRAKSQPGHSDDPPQAGRAAVQWRPGVMTSPEQVMAQGRWLAIQLARSLALMPGDSDDIAQTAADAFWELRHEQQEMLRATFRAAATCVDAADGSTTADAARATLQAADTSVPAGAASVKRTAALPAASQSAAPELHATRNMKLRGEIDLRTVCEVALPEDPSAPLHSIAVTVQRDDGSLRTYVMAADSASEWLEWLRGIVASVPPQCMQSSLEREAVALQALMRQAALQAGRERAQDVLTGESGHSPRAHARATSAHAGTVRHARNLPVSLPHRRVRSAKVDISAAVAEQAGRDTARGMVQSWSDVWEALEPVVPKPLEDAEEQAAPAWLNRCMVFVARYSDPVLSVPAHKLRKQTQRSVAVDIASQDPKALGHAGAQEIWTRLGSSGRLAALRLALRYAELMVLSCSEGLAVAAVLLAHIVSPSFVSVGLPLLIFLLILPAALSKPVRVVPPSYSSPILWKVLLGYLIAVVVVKYFVQLPLFCMDVEPDSTQWSLKRYPWCPSNASDVVAAAEVAQDHVQLLQMMGLAKVNPEYGGPGLLGAVFWDLVALFAVLFHRHCMRMRGLWRVDMQGVYKELAVQSSTTAAHAPRSEGDVRTRRGSVALSRVVDSGSDAAFVPDAIAAAGADAETSASVEANAGAVADASVSGSDHTVAGGGAGRPAALGADGEAAATAAGVGTVSTGPVAADRAADAAAVASTSAAQAGVRDEGEATIDDLLVVPQPLIPPASGPIIAGAHWHGMIFTSQLLSLLFTMFFYTAMTSRASALDLPDSAQVYTPGYFVAMLTHIAFLVLDHVAWLQRGRIMKWWLHVTYVCGLHATIFAITIVYDVPLAFNQQLVIWFYLLQVVYMIASALQVRSGYPVGRTAWFMTPLSECDDHHTLLGRVRWVVHVLYRHVLPLVSEVQEVLDWRFVRTTLSVFKWLQLRQLHSELSEASREVHLRSRDRRYRLGADRPKREKWRCCCAAVTSGVVLLILPLLVFTSLNPQIRPNHVTTVTALIDVVHAEATEQAGVPLFSAPTQEELRVATASEFDELRISTTRGLYAPVRSSWASRTQVARMPAHSPQPWQPTDRTTAALMRELQQPDCNVALRLSLIFLRPLPEGNNLVVLTQTTDRLPASQCQKLAHAIEGALSNASAIYRSEPLVVPHLLPLVVHLPSSGAAEVLDAGTLRNQRHEIVLRLQREQSYGEQGSSKWWSATMLNATQDDPYEHGVKVAVMSDGVMSGLLNSLGATSAAAFFVSVCPRREMPRCISRAAPRRR